MECFGNYRSDARKCHGCWLRDCCKLNRETEEEAQLGKIRNEGLAFLLFDGKVVSERRVAYDRSLVEFSRHSTC